MYNNKTPAVMEHNERHMLVLLNLPSSINHMNSRADKIGSMKHWQIKKITKV